MKKTNKDSISDKSKKLYWSRRLTTKLMIGFMVLIVFIVMLGIISYQCASDAIIKSYEKSAGQTIKMMNDYISYILDKEETIYSKFLNDNDLINYLNGFLSANNATQPLPAKAGRFNVLLKQPKVYSLKVIFFSLLLIPF